jgi:hypothetical protein
LAPKSALDTTTNVAVAKCQLKHPLTKPTLSKPLGAFVEMVTLGTRVTIGIRRSKALWRTLEGRGRMGSYFPVVLGLSCILIEYSSTTRIIFV